MKQKILFLLLALILCLSLLPTTVFAEGGGTPTITSVTPTAVTAENCEAMGLNSSYIGYYAIHTAAELYGFAEVVNNANASANAVLLADITVNSDVITNGALALDTSGFVRWTPIGAHFEDGTESGKTVEFAGTFDGKGYTIRGLYTTGRLKGVGLFGYATTAATIKNVTVADSYFEATEKNAAGIAGFLEGTAEQCASVNCVIKSVNQVGGIAGVLSNGTIRYCYCKDIAIIATSTDTSYGGYAGGLSGAIQNTSRMEYSYCTGSISCACRYKAAVTVLSGADKKNITVYLCYYNMSGVDKDYEQDVSFLNNPNVMHVWKGYESYFKSGYIAWSLNGEKAEGVWKQTLDGNNYPSFTGGTVYKNPKYGVYSNTPHTHEWSYSVSGNANIVAKCTKENECDISCRVTINAPSSLTCTGSAITARYTCDEKWRSEIGTQELPISYVYKTTKNGTYAATTDLTNAGWYKASITVGNSTAYVEYAVNKGTIAPTVTMSGYAYGSTLPTPEISGNSGGGEVTFYYSTANSNTGGTEWKDMTATTLNVGTYYLYATVGESGNYNGCTTDAVAFTVSKGTQTALAAPTGSYVVSSTDGNTFTYTVSADTEATNVEYKMDESAWQANNVFDGIAPLSTHTFYVRLSETANCNESPSSAGTQVTFHKLARTEVPTLAYTVSGQHTSRTVAIATVDGAEYSFDGGQTWQSDNRKTNIDGTNQQTKTVTIAIRYKETAVYLASQSATPVTVDTSKQPQTVHFALAQRTATYGDGILSALTATAKGAITYSSSDETVATVDERGVVTVRKAGVVTITALAAETDEYAAASASYVLTIRKAAQATLVVAAENLTVTYGKTVSLATTGGNGTGSVTYEIVSGGTGAATIDGATLTATGAGTVRLKAVKAGDENYLDAESRVVTATIAKAFPSATPRYTTITESGKTLADAQLSAAEGGTPGTITWVDQSGNVLPAATVIEPNTSYRWIFAPTDGQNYTTTGGFILLYSRVAEEESAEVGGKVTSQEGGTALDGVILTLKLGNTIVTTTVTDANGAYSFHHVAPGRYNLVAEKNGIIVTKMVTVEHNNIQQDFQLPPYKTNSAVEIKGDSSAALNIVVGGLDELFDETDRNTARGGSEVRFDFSVEQKQNDAPALAIQTEMEKTGGVKVGMVFSFNVTKTVTPDGGSSTATNITETSQLLTTVIQLPTELQGMSSYAVYRLHNGQVHVLTTIPNEKGEYIEVSADKTTITIHASQYSEYVIGYTVPSSGRHPIRVSTPRSETRESPETFDAGIGLYTALAAASLVGMSYMKKRKEN